MEPFQPLSSGTSFLRSLPYTATRHRGEVHNAILIPKLKRRFQYSPCRAPQQNIEERG